ncbi:MAG: transposase zinc-binding domain-containing protein [Nitrospirae bacterium]|nr:transposase zinc-binding domain-containing protein [Nitrospirota bacterium]
MAEALKGVYRPRTPQSTSFYQLIQDHGERLKNAYPDQYEQRFGYYRPITEKVFFRYLDCGILRYGFARIRCDHCHSEYLLPFSCKTRSFCPSCHFSLRSMQALPTGRISRSPIRVRPRLIHISLWIFLLEPVLSEAKDQSAHP